MAKSWIYPILGAILFIIPGAFAGLMLGAVIGGNFFTGFRFAGVQGYEATGVLGAWIGGGAGLFMGGWLGRRLALRGKGKSG